jgi:hypothetical protein
MRTLISLLTALIFIACLSVPLAAEPRQLYVQPSALVQVVEGLREAPPWAHLDLATQLLEALIEAYTEELDRSAAERGRDPARERRLARWRQAMELELRQLHHFQLRLSMSEDVRVSADRQGQVLLLVDGSPLLVSWPRVHGQGVREAALVERFCALTECPAPAQEGAARGIETPMQVRGAWSLSQLDGPGWESEGGVRCAFPDLQDRAVREARCRALAADLETLARVLAQVRREGAAIDWQEIRIDEESGGGAQRVIVNGRGDYLLLPLDALSAESVEWRAVARWLERRAGGVRSVETVLRL